MRRGAPHLLFVLLSMRIAGALGQTDTALLSFPSADDGQPWDVQAQQPGSTDSGSIATGGASVPFDGFGYLKLRVRRMDGTIRADTQPLRHFHLQRDGERYDSLSPVARGGIVVSRSIFAPVGRNWLRYFDSFANETNESLQLDIAWGGAVGLMQDGGWATVATTSAGGLTVDRSVGYVVMMQNVRHVADPLKGPSGNGPSAQVLGLPTSAVFVGAGDMYRDPFVTPYPGRDPAQIGYVFRLTIRPHQIRSLATFLVKGRSENFDPRGGRPLGQIPSDGAYSVPFPPVIAPSDRPIIPAAGSEIARMRAVAASLLEHPDFSGLTALQRGRIANWGSNAGSETLLDLTTLDMTELISMMRRREITSEDLLSEYLIRIGAFNKTGPVLNAVLSINPDVYSEARTADGQRDAGTLGILQGIPLLLKDNIDIKDIPTTAGLRLFESYRPKSDSFVAEKLRQSGAIFLGKANLAQFPFGDFGESELGGRVRNAFDGTLNSAGSSSGSAVAVAWGLAPASYGTDTCNSLSNLAAFASLFTIRTTLGLTSRAGVMPLEPLNDAVGPMAKSARDIALMIDLTAGTDPDDAMTHDADLRRSRSYVSSLNNASLRGKRIGFLRQLYWDFPADPEIPAAMEHIKTEFRKSGATVLDITVKDLKRFYDYSAVRYGATGTMARMAWKRYLARGRWTGREYRDVDDLLSSQALDTEAMAAFKQMQNAPPDDALAVGYAALMERRSEFRAAFVGTLERYHLDALAYPANLSRPETMEGGRVRYGYEPGNCAESSKTGLPQVTIPGVFIDEGRLPFGFSILGRQWGELQLLEIAHSYENATHHHRAPAESANAE